MSDYPSLPPHIARREAKINAMAEQVKLSHYEYDQSLLELQRKQVRMLEKACFCFRHASFATFDDFNHTVDRIMQRVAWIERELNRGQDD